MIFLSFFDTQSIPILFEEKQPFLFAKLRERIRHTFYAMERLWEQDTREDLDVSVQTRGGKAA